jgi:hypothetical protein
MKKIDSSTNLKEILQNENVVIFYEAEWSAYARISQSMISLVESYLKAKRNDIHFYTGAFEGELSNLGKELTCLGASEGNFLGNGALSFFKNGILKEDINSLIGEGNYKLWTILRTHYGEC